MAPVLQSLPQAALTQLLEEYVSILGGAVWVERLNPDGTRITPPPDAEDKQGGNFFCNRSYHELLGRYCTGREWTKYVRNKVYISSYDEWIDQGCPGIWRHKLIWEMPDGSIRKLHTTANLTEDAKLIVGRVRYLHGERDPLGAEATSFLGSGREWVIGAAAALVAGGALRWLL